ncbi:MAG TPA: site-specific integrase, partial [Segeticoccus sp.]|uniref:tyrosine-type recombinase/integrase n=1 Tax=Segeticoccus sp. TaxID=2706531 RepID=UPI002D8071B7
RAYVLPHIGRQRLQAIRPATLSTLYRTLLASGGRDGRPLSVRTVEYVHAVLRKAFHDAVVSDQILGSNPAERAKRPRKQGSVKRRDVWSAEQLRSFLVTASEHRLSAFYRLAAYTGARRGELLNLTWNDVVLEARTVRIRGSVGIVDGKRVEGTTKGGRERVVSIDAGTAEILGQHLERQQADEERAGGSWVTGDWVFRMEIGAPLFPDTVTALMAKLVRQHNQEAKEKGRPELPPMRLHDLRHVHATLLLRAGVPAHVVASRLGHADPAITLRVYAHVLEDQASEVAQVFAKVMEG